MLNCQFDPTTGSSNIRGEKTAEKRNVTFEVNKLNKKLGSGKPKPCVIEPNDFFAVHVLLNGRKREAIGRKKHKFSEFLFKYTRTFTVATVRVVATWRSQWLTRRCIKQALNGNIYVYLYRRTFSADLARISLIRVEVFQPVEMVVR